MIADETVYSVKVEELPSYVYCDVEGCDAKHYLSFSKDVRGNWSCAYIEYDNNMACLFINDAVTIEEAAIRMKYSLERHKYEDDEDTSTALK